MTNLRTMFTGCMDTESIEDVGLSGLLPGLGPDDDGAGWPMVQDTWGDEK